jgi:hypothetical protein
VSITEDAPVRVTPLERSDSSRVVSWWWLVTASLAVLLIVAAVLAVWWARTLETRTTTYRVLGDLEAVRLDVGDANVEIDGGAPALEVRQVEKFAFGRPSAERHTVENGTLNIEARCRDQVLGTCDASFHLAVPDNVAIDIETARGTVRLAAVRASAQISTASGDVEAVGFCGFSLAASSDSGNLGVVAECPTERLELRSRSGDVSVTVPAGRYSIDAQSDTGEVHTRGLVPIEDAGFQIQAQSTSGDVTVQAAG